MARRTLRPAALALAGLAAVAAGACSAPAGEPQTAVKEVVDALRTAPAANALPLSFSQGDGSLNADDARLVHAGPTSRQYLTTNDRGEICLISELFRDPRGPVSGSSCATVAMFEERGLPLVVGGAGGAAAAIAVPDRYERVMGPGGPEPVALNTVVVEAADVAALPSTLEFELAGGGSHTLRLRTGAQ